TSFLLFHEVSSEGAEDIIKEGHRLLRPGGVFYSRDQRDWTKLRERTAFSRYQSSWIWRWNHEVWQRDHNSNDYPKMLSSAGFQVANPRGEKAVGNASSELMGTKPA
ncbi:MAG: hypothetical protein HOO09_13210, partial [Rhodospirillaceae bacterium]|nr:hypothetical protein [Rhodospirillaceae bacterium]